MPPEIIRAGLRLGLMVLLLAVGSIALLRPTSPEFWAALLAAVIALVFVGALLLLLSLSRQRPPWKESPHEHD